MDNDVTMNTNPIETVETNGLDTILDAGASLEQPIDNTQVEEKNLDGDLDTFLATLATDTTVIGGIDFKDIAESLDLDTPEGREALQEEINTLRSMGYNDEQIMYSAKEAVDAYKSGYESALEELEGKEPNPQEVRELLIRELTKEELRNLKPLSNWVREVAGDLIQDPRDFQSLFSDPSVIRFLHRVYSASVGKNNVREVYNRQRNMVQIDPTQAMSQYIGWLNAQPSVSRKDTFAKIQELKQHIKSDDIPAFDELFKVLM